ncbi:HIR complex subunit, partial [Teratosphaeriaceae sp. CCFEE 6253]
QQGVVPIVHNTPEGLVPASAATAKARNGGEVPEVLRPAIVSPALSVAQVRLAVPLVRSVILRPLDLSKSHDDILGDSSNSGTGTAEGSIVFEARNATAPSRTGRAQDREPARITLTRRTHGVAQTLWQDFLPRAVLLTTGDEHFWAAGCEDGSLHTWTPAGRRMLSAIVLEAQPVVLECRGWWMLCVTAVGMVHIWDLRTQTAMVRGGVSLAPVLDAAATSSSVAAGGPGLTSTPSLMFARLNSEGRVVVGMSNGEGFAYHTGMGVWQRLSESWWAVGSQYWNTADTSLAAPRSGKASASNGTGSGTLDPESLSAGILPLLERHTTTHALLKGRAYFLQRLVKSLLSAEGYEGFETSVSVAHLEHRLAAAWTLGARDEFRVYLLMYAKRIGAEGAGVRGKVEELLHGLMGKGLFESTGEEEAEGVGDVEVAGALQWGDGEEILGWKREDLLREVVVALGRQRDLQRVTVPYARLLGILDGLGSANDGVGDGNGMVVDDA